MTPERATAILQERAARKARVARMVAHLQPRQREAVLDPKRFKIYFCTRRAGKSYAIGTELLTTAMAYPRSSCLYLGLTRDSAKSIMNKDVIRVLNDRYKIGAEWRESSRAWILPNGSYVYIRGADANEYEISKIVGQKYRMVALDEASKFRQDLRNIIYGAIVPAMGDDLGTVILAGTPSNVVSGLFYEQTTKPDASWSVHRWSWKDNGAKLANIQLAHDELVADKPGIELTPLYKQEWCGEWVVDFEALVYRWREDKNTVPELPVSRNPYTYVLGGDLGFNDPSALVVSAYQEHDPVLYILQAIKVKGATISDVADLIKSLWKCPSEGLYGPYDFSAMVIDASALQAVEEMRQRHHLPLEAAKKPGKRGVIEAMNSDLSIGRVKVLPAASALTDEWAELIWDEKSMLKREWVERSSCQNHASDAALYNWRKARAYDAAEPPPPKATEGSEDYQLRKAQERVARAVKLEHSGGVIWDEPPPWLEDMERRWTR